MLNDRVTEIFEKMDWSIINIFDTEIEIETWSPAGENLVETLDYDGTTESLIKSIKEMVDCFDVDDHVEMWIEAKNSTRGVPQSTRVLVEDAEAIKEMYENLYDAFLDIDTDDNKNSNAMNKEEFYNYIIENFNISGSAARLINNILDYAESQGFDEEELYNYLCSMLDGTIGLSDNEIKRAYF